MPESELISHLHKLCVEIGARPIGSPANHAAARYIEGVFSACQLEVERQEYPCITWESQGTSLAANGRPLTAEANPFSPPCQVSGPAVVLATLSELQCTELAGRIAVLYGDLTRTPLPPKSWQFKSEEDARVVQLLEEKQPLALLTIQGKAGELDRLVEDWEFTIPSATLPARPGLELLHLIEGQAVAVQLSIHSRQSAGSTANVVGRKAGEGAEKVVLCAHYDTKIDTPGALDNAGGVAVLLCLAQRLCRSSLPFELEFVAFTGEEYLPLGDDEYVRRAGDSFARMLAAINFDGCGCALDANTITVIAESQPFQEQVAALRRTYPALAWVEPWPESNHSTFAFRGVPAVAFSSRSAEQRAHLRSDTIEWLSPAKLKEVADLTEEMILKIKRPG